MILKDIKTICPSHTTPSIKEIRAFVAKKTYSEDP